MIIRSRTLSCNENAKLVSKSNITGGWEMKPRTVLLVALILGAAALRLVPHPSNFTPIGALALFAGAQFDDKRWAAFIIPLAAMLLSDIVIGVHSGMPVIYLAFAAIVCMGF